MATINFTWQDLNKISAEQAQTPIQDCVGNNYTIGAPLAMVANTEYPFVCNGATRNAKMFPAHITTIWDVINNKATFAEFYNIAEIVANVQFTFSPTSANAGTLTLNVYVNETVPILMKSYTVAYKATTERYTILSTFYAGADTGFDVKNKGVIFKVSASGAGNLYNTAIEIYKT